MEENVCPRCSLDNTAIVGRGLPDLDVGLQGCFGTPTEHYERSTKRIRFYLGGYSDGYHDLTLVKRAEGASIHYNPPYAAENTSPIDRRITDDEWATLVRDLYGCSILDWNAQYNDPSDRDGTLWELKVMFDDRTRLKWEGSNAYPPHMKDLLEVLVKYGLLGSEVLAL